MNCLNEALKVFPKLDIPGYQKCLDQDYIEKHTNDCGDKTTAWFVPNDILGLDIRLACKIHDLDYNRIINIWNSYPDIVFYKSENSEGYKKNLKECEKLFKEANKRFKKNIKVLADYKFEENKNGVFSLLFWRSELRQAKIRKKEHYKAADLYFWAVKNFGWSSLEKSFKENRR